MLIALNSDGVRVYGSEAHKEEEYYCQQCEQRVIPKKGHTKIHHFAHYPGSPSCVWWEPESETHLRMKDNILKSIKRAYKKRVTLIEPEYEIEYDTEWLEHDILGGGPPEELCLKLELLENRKLFPDVFTKIDFPSGGKRIAIECQKSNKSADDIILKTQMYSLMGIYTLWIFDDVWGYSNNWTFSDFITVPSMIRQLHTLNYGRIYTINRSGVITAYHIYGIFKTFTPLYPLFSYNCFDSKRAVRLKHRCDICNRPFLEYNREFLDPERYNVRICRSCFDKKRDSCDFDFGQPLIDYKPRTEKEYTRFVVRNPYLVFYEINGLKIARFNDRKWW